jgi:hypothetical protein
MHGVGEFMIMKQNGHKTVTIAAAPCPVGPRSSARTRQPFVARWSWFS